MEETDLTPFELFIEEEACNLVDEVIATGCAAPDSIATAFTKIAAEFFKQQSPESLPTDDNSERITKITRAAHFYLEKNYLHTYTSFWFSLLNNAIRSALDELNLVELRPPFVAVPREQEIDEDVNLEPEKFSRKRIIDPYLSLLLSFSLCHVIVSVNVSVRNFDHFGGDYETANRVFIQRGKFVGCLCDVYR